MPQAAPILGQIALNLIIGIGLSYVSSLLRPKTQKNPKPTKSASTRGATFDLSAGEDVPVFSIVGKARTEGQLLFAQSYGTNNDFLKLVFACGKGGYDGIDTVICDEKVSTLSGSGASEDGFVVDNYKLNAAGVPSPSGTPYMWMKFHNGDPGQAADAGLIHRANPVNRWTSAFPLTATPYVVVTMRYHAIFGSTIPRFGFVWRGLKLYDWRKDSTIIGGSGSHRWDDPTTWEWSENPAVIAWNYRRGIFVNSVRIFGMGLSFLSNDLSYFTATANLADEDVFFEDTDETLPRYAYGKAISTDDEPASVLEDLEASWCGDSFDRGGGYAPVPAASVVTVMTLTDADRVLGNPVTADKFGRVSEKKTSWGGEFISASDGWVTKAYPTQSNNTLKTLIGGTRTEKFDQDFEYTTERAQMRAGINLAKMLFPATRVETFGPKALVLEPGDAILRDCEWGVYLMIVDSVDPTEARDGATVTMHQWDNSIVGGEPFIIVPSESGINPEVVDKVLAVSGLNVVSYTIQSAGGVEQAGARASWSPIVDLGVEQVMVRVWPTDGIEDNDAIDRFQNARLNALILGPLAPLTEYSYWAKPIRADGADTFPTSTGAFFTDESSYPPGPGSITNEELSTEWRNAIEWVVGDGPGALVDRLNDALDQLGASVTTNTMASDRDRRTVSAQVGEVGAAVVDEITARADADGALAEQILAVAAQSASGLAEGLFTVRAESGPAGVAVRLQLMARVTTLDDYQDTGLLIDLISDGAGGYISKILLKADSIYLTDGDTQTSPFIFSEGVATLAVANIGTIRAGNIISTSGSSFWILGTGAFRLST